MRDKRPVDELSVEELERVLAIKRREERQQRMTRMQRTGRMIETVDASPVTDSASDVPPPAASDVPPPPTHDPVAAALASLTQPASRETAFSSDPSPRFEDNTVEPPPPPAQIKARKRARRRIMDRVLLLIEVLAVIMIVVIGVNLFQAIGKLDVESAKAQQLADEQRRLTIPTIAPTPTIRLENIVLPGGHIYAGDGSAPQFNYNEIPASLYARVQSEWVQPVLNRPPQTSETALALIVPKLSLNGTIVQGVDWEALKQGVGQVPNGVNPGDDVGNVAFAAHNDIYGKLFQHLDQLQVGDNFQIQTKTAIYTYTVTKVDNNVAPTDTSVLGNRQGATATLISCYPYQVDNKRIVVFADRVS
jgi:sortase A